MSALGETLATALVLSGLAACCLALLPRTPPRIRFGIAAWGLPAWLVPWGAIHIALPSSSAAAPLVEWLGGAQASTLQPAQARLDASAALGVAVAAAFFVGFVLFVCDCVALRRCLRSWRARSRPGEHLRALLPGELAAVAADIRIVDGSAIAAASGALRPTIWLGGRHTEAQLRVALVHETWHVRARDPVWVALIALVRRAYWWNPLVAHLARQALLMIESACDHRCAAQLGKAHYMSQLASLLLAGTAPATFARRSAGCGDLRSPQARRHTVASSPVALNVEDARVGTN